MAKVTLEFDLETEKELYESFYKGPSYQVALWNFSNYLRSEVKYGDDEVKQGICENIRSKFFEFLREEEIEI